MDPHAPYRSVEPYVEKVVGNDMKARVSAAYDSEIRYTDEYIRKLSEELDWDENTLIILTSDHGEEFWEHGKLGHGKTLYTEVVGVPTPQTNSTDS